MHPHKSKDPRATQKFQKLQQAVESFEGEVIRTYEEARGRAACQSIGCPRLAPSGAYFCCVDCQMSYAENRSEACIDRPWYPKPRPSSRPVERPEPAEGSREGPPPATGRVGFRRYRGPQGPPPKATGPSLSQGKAVPKGLIPEVPPPGPTPFTTPEAAAGTTSKSSPSHPKATDLPEQPKGATQPPPTTNAYGWSEYG